MELWKNLPLLMIVLPLLSAAITAALPARAGKAVVLSVLSLEVVSAAFLLYCVARTGTFTYALSEFGAPFGNELRAGELEGFIALGFSVIMLLSVMGGWHNLTPDITDRRLPQYLVVLLLIPAALMALTFTNDMFTGYVFIEILTIASCALISAREERGRAVFAAVRYMIMNLLGSGLFLLGLSMLYCLTGYLHFPQILATIASYAQSGQYELPLTASLLLMVLGVAVKSALSPFHTWLPSAYSNATTVSSSLLSSLISKAYIVLLIKVICLGTGLPVFQSTAIPDVLLVFALVGTILGSLDAIMEHNLRRMIAYSSVAQIGYIFLGIAMGTEAGIAAAVFHIFAHSAAKAMLFPASDRLSDVSGRSHAFRDLRGAGIRSPLSGVAFTVGACSITGVPILGGFCGKMFLMDAASGLAPQRMWAILIVLLISTVLNVMYFLRTVITIYRPGQLYPYSRVRLSPRPLYTCSIVCFMALNVFLGVAGGSVMRLILSGLADYI